MAANRRNLYRSALCIYLLAVCLLCFINPSSMPDTEFDIHGLDKIVHLFMFLPFPVLSYLSFEKRESSGREKLTKTIIISAIGCAIAIATEYIQKLTGYRSFEYGDMAADITGLLIGGTITLIYITLTKHPER